MNACAFMIRPCPKVKHNLMALCHFFSITQSRAFYEVFFARNELDYYFTQILF